MSLEAKRFKRRLYNHGLSGLMRLAPGLPEGAALALGRGLGRLAGQLRPRRRMIMEHLRMAFGEERDEAELQAIARGFYEHVFRTFFEVLRLGAWSRDTVLARTELEGSEHLDAALAQGHGAIVISGHLGNWEIGGTALCRRGYPMTVVSQPQRHSLFQDYLAELRLRHGMALIPLTSLRDCFTTLRENRALALMIDQRVRKGGVIVPFFGHPASCPPGPAAIALKTGAPVISIATKRLLEPGGPPRHRVRISPPIPLIDTGDREADILANTARHQREIEEAIRRLPEQWLWTHRRWGMKVVVPRRARGEQRKGTADEHR